MTLPATELPQTAAVLPAPDPQGTPVEVVGTIYAFSTRQRMDMLTAAMERIDIRHARTQDALYLGFRADVLTLWQTHRLAQPDALHRKGLSILAAYGRTWARNEEAHGDERRALLDQIDAVRQALPHRRPRLLTVVTR